VNLVQDSSKDSQDSLGNKFQSSYFCSKYNSVSSIQWYAQDDYSSNYDFQIFHIPTMTNLHIPLDRDCRVLFGTRVLLVVVYLGVREFNIFIDTNDNNRKHKRKEWDNTKEQKKNTKIRENCMYIYPKYIYAIVTSWLSITRGQCEVRTSRKKEEGKEKVDHNEKTERIGMTLSPTAYKARYK